MWRWCWGDTTTRKKRKNDELDIGEEEINIWRWGRRALLEKALLNCPYHEWVLSFLLKCAFIYTEKCVHYLLLIFSCISTENIIAEYLVKLSVHLLLFTENLVNMPGNFSKKRTSHQSVVDWQGSKQQRTSCTILYISQQRTCGTSVSRGPAVRCISQQRTSSTSVSIGPAVLYSVHQSAEDLRYISWQMTSCTVHQSERTSST